MRDADLEFLLVLDRRIRLVGLLAEEDLARAGSADLEVDKVMSTRLLKCTPDEDIVNVARMMTSANVGVAIVTEGEHLIGVLTMGDLVHGLRFEGD
jgi:CBS domain-containing protein